MLIIFSQIILSGDHCCLTTPFAQHIRAKVLQQVKPSDIVLFDIDGVLLTAQDPYIRGMHQRTDVRGTINELLMATSPLAKQHCKKKREALYSMFIAQNQERAVDNEMTELVHDLQALNAALGSEHPTRHISTMAITQAQARQFGTIPSLAEWRSQQLAKVKHGGISFKNSFPAYNGLQFPQLAKNGNIPCVVDGILIACQACTKSTLFYEFLKTVYKIKEPLTAISREEIKKAITGIHMIEDSEENLEDMHSFCKNTLGIPYYGYHFIGERLLAAPFHAPVAAVQLKHLLTHEKWLGHDEAEEIYLQEIQEEFKNLAIAKQYS